MVTDAEVTAAAKSLLKMTAIKDIQSELTKLDAVAMLSGEQMDRYYLPPSHATRGEVKDDETRPPLRGFGNEHKETNDDHDQTEKPESVSSLARHDPGGAAKPNDRRR